MKQSVWQDEFEREFISELNQFSSKKIFVGYSGGIDSSVLLTLCCQLLPAKQIIAIHVNHQLSSSSDEWQSHCEHRCEYLGCQFIARKVSIQNKGEGVEAAARKERYNVFKQIVDAGGVLVLGQHLDDQVETFFLRLLRGASLHGLQAMQKQTQRDQYTLLRPLLGLTREKVETYAQILDLHWQEDESNTDLTFDRNYLRHKVLPVIAERWPHYPKRIESVVERLQEKARFTSDVAHQLQARLTHDAGLKIDELSSLSESEVRSLLHQWLIRQGHSVPSAERLNALVTDVLHARPDRQPRVQIGDGVVRRHNLVLYWVKDQDEIGPAPKVTFDTPRLWQGIGLVGLVAQEDNLPRLKTGLPNLNWRLREQGETIHPIGRSKRRDLKRLFQEHNYKPWLRSRTPLLFSDDHLIAVGTLLIDQNFLAKADELGCKVIWQITQNEIE